MWKITEVEEPKRYVQIAGMIFNPADVRIVSFHPISKPNQLTKRGDISITWTNGDTSIFHQPIADILLAYFVQNSFRPEEN